MLDSLKGRDDVSALYLVFFYSTHNILIRDRPRLFDQVRHQTTNASIENKPFFTKQWPRQAYQNYEQPCQRSQNSEFQSHFSVSKIGWIFPKKISVKNIWLEDQLILMKFFENFNF